MYQINIQIKNQDPGRRLEIEKKKLHSYLILICPLQPILRYSPELTIRSYPQFRMYILLWYKLTT